jgi:predicted Rossmann fold flavoprotein
MVYDLIIIGAGAAGLFAGAALPHPINGLILEKKSSPGRKLLMSGSGQCNLTHGGSIKDFIGHYGKNGSRIRSVLYQFNNQAVMSFFEKNGVPLFLRNDEKVFPKSLKAQDILNVLTKLCKGNGLRTVYSSPVDQISFQHANSGHYTVRCDGQIYEAKALIIATGGCSYPGTGSDGSFFNILKELGIKHNPTTPALVPIFVDGYPFHDLSGIAFPDAEVTVGSHRFRDALLLTHSCFSGPAVLMISRYAKAGDTIILNYDPGRSEGEIFKDLYRSLTGNSKQLLTALQDFFKDSDVELPKRFLETVCMRTGLDPAEKASRFAASQLKSVVRLLVHDEYLIKSLGGFESAMVTTGGASLSEIDLKTMESVQYPNLYFAGEVLDVDGDTGGYNLQFAFSSGYLAAKSLTESINR